MSKHDNIRGFVENLFQNAPRGTRVTDLKEELIINLTDKYDDLIAAGYGEDDAYGEILKNIGDVDELLDDIKREENYPRGGDSDDKSERERKERLRSLLYVLSFGLYFLSFIVFLFPDFLYINRSNSVPSALVLIGIATGILIYTAVSLPKYKKSEDTLIEDFKAWRNTHNNLKKIRNTLISIIWCATPVLYFIISFTYGGWHITWLIFLFAAAVQQAVIMFFSIAIWKNTDKSARKFKNSLISLIWCSTPFLYFIISFGYMNWHISWIIFPLAAVATQIVNVLFDVKKK